MGLWHVVKAYLLYTWGGLHRYFGNQNNVSREYRRAVHYFTRAYETNPSMRQARLARAILLWREMERIEEALSDLDALLEEDATYAPALLNRAMAYQQRGNYRRALRDLESYLKLPPDAAYWNTAVRMERMVRELIEEGDGP